MKAKIINFHLDDIYDWVADLECGHTQHVRHNPPFANRPWVVDPDLRAEKIGFELNCLKCDNDLLSNSGQ